MMGYVWPCAVPKLSSISSHGEKSTKNIELQMG